VFCENCTWAHFESSSKCPKCGRGLGEEDFTELVVGARSEDLKKVSLQVRDMRHACIVLSMYIFSRH
jgi:hypothetical protein